MSRMRFMVELVTDIVMAASGLARSKGSGDHPLSSETAWHFGFYSRPKDGARGVVLKADGQGNTSFLIGYRDKQYELSLEKGECGMRNAYDAQVLLNQDGDVIATAASGRTFQANGSDYAMPKWDDGATGGFVGALNIFLNAAKIATTAAQIAAAATTFSTAMSTATNFSSTKAKNG